MYNKDKAGDVCDTDGPIGPLLGAREIEGMQIFEEEEAKKPVEAPVQMNVGSSTIMVLEVAAVYSADRTALLDNQYIASVKEELKLRCQPTRYNKKLLREILKDTMNSKLVRYSTLE